MTLLYIFLIFLLAQRLIELVIAHRHEMTMRRRGAVEIDSRGYRVIVLMHAAFFASIIAEKAFLHRPVSHFWIALLAVFAAAQILRYWAIGSLGAYWNTKILVAADHVIIKKGPYKFIRHPNYVAVATEIAVVPMIFSCYLTAVAFTVLNAILLRRRIQFETRALVRGGKEKCRTELPHKT